MATGTKTIKTLKANQVLSVFQQQNVTIFALDCDTEETIKATDRPATEFKEMVSNPKYIFYIIQVVEN